ncbi:N2,N2-dimethylguanosine tRNA methyltransferase [Halapricum desulfuricans]|uniref:tRNA (guanine(26)-N(2))-dimethyltransferase n=2 Tax=Halapricum desulfuricans TaxID=2841257 RepID=A0A897NBW2_9EURY|nr:N2,N2-dimethylguanosine tRNA methyltransferase [Halapricum desulfuricans]
MDSEDKTLRHRSATDLRPGRRDVDMRVTEGSVEIEVPEQPEAGIGDGVFYNPVQELNRDLTVAVLRAARERFEHAETYLDATAASGVRGVRAAAEGWDVTLCDRDEDAVELCRTNLDRNGLAGEVVNRNVNALMHERRFDVVDLDPFGTPIPFADAAVRSAIDLLAVTATDTAPLCGAHFESGVRSYSAVPRNTEYHREMGVRILLGALARTAARYDRAITPVTTHATKHYVRTYLALADGATVANRALDELGHVHHCQHCLWRTHERGLIADPPAECPNCGEHLQTAGPLWLGPVHDREFLERVGQHVDDGMGTAEEARELTERLAAELATPTHYDQHRLAKRWGEGAMAMDDFLERLRNAGHEASRTHYGGTTFKTDADVTGIDAAIHTD